MKVFLSKRQMKILRALKTQNHWIRGSELARMFQVSARTIRKDLESIKSVVGLEIIEASRQEGYRLNLAIDLDSLDIQEVLSPSERVVLLAKSLIVNPQGIDLYDLSSELIVAESTLLGDLQMIKREIAGNDFQLAIERKGDQLVLKGNLVEKNAFLVFLIKRLLSNTRIDNMQELFLGFDLPLVTDRMLNLLMEENFFSRYLSLRSLMITLFLIMERSVMGIGLEKEEGHPDLNGDSINHVTELMLDNIQNELDLQLDPPYIQLLDRCIDNVREMEEIENRIRNMDILKDPFYDDFLSILMDVVSAYDLDFVTNNKNLRDLIVHLKIAMYRAERNMRITNPIKDQIKNEYPFLFDVGIFISKKIEEKTNLYLNSDEVSFIVSYLANTYREEKEKQVPIDKLRVLLVALEGRAIAKYIHDRISVFHQNMMLEVQEISSFSQVKEFDQQVKEFDVMIATSLIKISNRKPDLLIHPNVNLNDEFNINALIAKKLDLVRKKNFEIMIHTFFKKEFFVPKGGVKNQQEALDWICANLMEEGYVDADFQASVEERESLISTGLETGIALPHATTKKSIKTVVSVMNFDKPILWGNTKVMSVMLFAVAKDDLRLLNQFYGFIAQFCMEQKNIEELQLCSEYSAFIELLNRVYMTGK